MKLAQTIATLSEVTEENWIPESGMRIIPENKMEENALSQIWAKQSLEVWSLEGREIPFDKAGFAEAIELTEDGFAKGSVILHRDGFNPLSSLSRSSSRPITIFWLWEDDQIKAYWSILKADTTYLLNDQSNYASYPIVFL